MFIQHLVDQLVVSFQTSPSKTIALLGLLIVLSYFVANEAVRARARIPHFDGPQGLPVVGNLYQLQTNAAQKYREWAKVYGPVYQIQLGNIPILVVNSAAAARNILGGHSGATASRPEFYTFHKVRVPSTLEGRH